MGGVVGAVLLADRGPGCSRAAGTQGRVRCAINRVHIQCAVEMHGVGKVMGVFQCRDAHASVQGHAELSDVAVASLCDDRGDCREVVDVQDPGRVALELGETSCAGPGGECTAWAQGLDGMGLWAMDVVGVRRRRKGKCYLPTPVFWSGGEVFWSGFLERWGGNISPFFFFLPQPHPSPTAPSHPSPGPKRYTHHPGLHMASSQDPAQPRIEKHVDMQDPHNLPEVATTIAQGCYRHARELSVTLDRGMGDTALEHAHHLANAMQLHGTLDALEVLRFHTTTTAHWPRGAIQHLAGALA